MDLEQLRRTLQELFAGTTLRLKSGRLDHVMQNARQEIQNTAVRLEEWVRPYQYMERRLQVLLTTHKAQGLELQRLRTELKDHPQSFFLDEVGDGNTLAAFHTATESERSDLDAMTDALASASERLGAALEKATCFSFIAQQKESSLDLSGLAIDNVQREALAREREELSRIVGVQSC
ncbi:hypothetical protein DQ04_08551020 [Trypanosoma grayi]|uniref:hypothetical protein n=1 Tax=Trypanosoma grayi TaxID=71804 RepID=UPI0004F42901|nr:hypothetical protein DQ04_08551020 [Trypanosoma grayi]KEG07889.1 hypothetical protein DQ04_08551020 [Trypanosoma grayi]